MHKRPALLIAVVSKLIGVSVARAGSLYTVTDLGTFGGTGSQAASVNAGGQVVGIALIAGNARSDGFQYSNGVLTDLTPGVGGSAVSINDAGQAVGKSGGKTAVFANGGVTNLTVSGGGITGVLSNPTDINNAGQVVGWAATASAYRGFLYQNGVTTNLGTLGSDSYAESINNSGQIVGYYYVGGTTQGFLYQNGSNTALTAFSQPLAINDSGQIVGTQSNSSFGCLSTNNTITTLNQLGIFSRALSLNNAGDVVGYYSFTGSQPTGRLAFVYSNGVMTDLNTLTTGSGWTLEQANDINAAGQIVGYGINPAGNEDAFVLTPVPQPIVVSAGQTFHVPAGTGTGIVVTRPAGVTIAATGAVVVDPAANHANRTLLIVGAPGLSLAGSNAGWTGTVDLGNNDMVLPGADLSTVTSQLAQGYAGGAWNGPGGITSSTSAVDPTHRTALGVIRNNGAGTPIYTATNPFDGIVPGASDVLIKYTYYGDANIDGRVDGSDYTKIDAGFLSGDTLSGWGNGDFNYDGVIDGSDYTLIDNTFNTQNANLAVRIQPTASLAAVPEPAMLMALPWVVFLGRRRRAIHRR